MPAAAKAYEALRPALRSSGNRSLLGHALLEAGQTQLAVGDYQRASERGGESASIFHLLKDAANEALANNVTGSAQLYRGDYGPAMRSFEQALELDRRQHDGKGEITRLSNIGNVYFFQGKYLDALQSYERALRRVEETAAEPWNAGRRQLVLTNLAILYEQLGQNQRALDYYKQALALGSGLIPSEYAQLLSNAGTLYRRLGDAVKALETYQAAQKVFSREHLSAGEIHVLQNAGIALALDLRDLNGALKAFTQALKLAEATHNRRETVLAHVFRGEALYRMERWKDAGLDYSEALAGAREIGATEEQWTALYGLGRIERREGKATQALLTFRESIAAIESVRAGLGSSSLKAEFLANKRDVYDATIDLMLQAPERDPERLFGMFEQARSRNLQDMLRSATGPPTLRAVQSRLGSKSLLIEYWAGSGHVAALWISKYGSGVLSRPLTAEDAASVQNLAAALRNSERTAWRGPAEHLGALLLSGVPLEGKISQLLIVPDGLLSSVPFELLATGSSAPLVVERFAVSYLPSAALLMRDYAPQWPLEPWRRQLIAFGDPIVDARNALPDDTRWSRLPESVRELRSISRALPGMSVIHAGPTTKRNICLTARRPVCRCCTSARMQRWIARTRTAHAFCLRRSLVRRVRSICSEARYRRCRLPERIWLRSRRAIRRAAD